MAMSIDDGQGFKIWVEERPDINPRYPIQIRIEMESNSYRARVNPSQARQLAHLLMAMAEKVE